MYIKNFCGSKKNSAERWCCESGFSREQFTFFRGFGGHCHCHPQLRQPISITLIKKVKCGRFLYNRNIQENNDISSPTFVMVMILWWWKWSTGSNTKLRHWKGTKKELFIFYWCHSGGSGYKSERFIKRTCFQQALFDMTMVTIMFDTKSSESESLIDEWIEGIINIMVESHHF